MKNYTLKEVVQLCRDQDECSLCPCHDEENGGCLLRNKPPYALGIGRFVGEESEGDGQALSLGTFELYIADMKECSRRAEEVGKEENHITDAARGVYESFHNGFQYACEMFASFIEKMKK